MKIKKSKITQKITKVMTTAAVTASAVCFLSSCSDNDTLYFSYKPVDNERWEKSDDLHFVIAPQRYKGSCKGFVVLRMNDKYPYKNMSVNVETCLHGVKSIKRVDFDIRHDNQGIRHEDYIMPVNKLYVDETDTVRVRISHNMKTNTLHGITDVGVKVIKK